MKVKEMADLAGTTTRTVRHYHHLGLLPVPPTRGMPRDYGIEHLARLMRIRWLAESGMSLERIGHLLAQEAHKEEAPSSPGGPSDEDGAAAAHPKQQERATSRADSDRSALDDLEATLSEIDQRIALLRRQRRRVDQLVQRVRRGEDLSGLPGAVEDFYRDIMGRVRRPGAHRLVRDKKHIGTFLMTSGLLPTTALALFLDEFGEDERALCAELLDRFDALTDLPPNDPTCTHAGRALAEEVGQLIARHAASGLDMVRMLPGGRLGTRMWSRYGNLMTLTFRHPAQRALAASILAHIATDPHLAPGIAPDLRKEWTREHQSH
ncbi:MerR family transcriptional regulator [Schaalia sp. 19OD2882]|uniref:MerR family transcriptional regulator n=1 Tax=Schaalia sp. 19OD2882 TaxID=2794089 RepID=UPI001C1ED021|nr:MerR family transcriptional regulator [Schaalia sp. 19OD2882]QWW19914.1 MerR family transcriptional regulator [Schaalia sp. 19OD2882]